MRVVRYKRVKDREWVQPKMKGYKLACCDCGLVHVLDFAIVGTRKLKVQFRARRAVGLTKELRQRRGIRVRTDK